MMASICQSSCARVVSKMSSTNRKRPVKRKKRRKKGRKEKKMQMVNRAKIQK